MTTAIALVLLGFGAALGLSVTSPYEGEGIDASLFPIAAGVWFLWVQLVSFSAGGYVAARLARPAAEATEHQIDVRDGMHGLLVWATAVVIAAAIAFAGIGGVSTAPEASPVEQITDVATDVVSERAAEDVAPEGEPAPAEAMAADEEAQVEAARRLGVIAGFVTAASILLGAVAAFYCAGVGGRHRDSGAVVRFFVQSR
jgi:hypothetical protein